jgi:hypothetical protein
LLIERVVSSAKWPIESVVRNAMRPIGDGVTPGNAGNEIAEVRVPGHPNAGQGTVKAR